MSVFTGNVKADMGGNLKPNPFPASFTPEGLLPENLRAGTTTYIDKGLDKIGDALSGNAGMDAALQRLGGIQRRQRVDRAMSPVSSSLAGAYGGMVDPKFATEGMEQDFARERIGADAGRKLRQAHITGAATRTKYKDTDAGRLAKLRDVMSGHDIGNWWETQKQKAGLAQAQAAIGPNEKTDMLSHLPGGNIVKAGGNLVKSIGDVFGL